jgi:general secretion pathway protein E/type IV pilus assembly protein PilB
MTQLLIEPARRTGCEDIPALTEVLLAAAQRQRSPIDDVLDAGVVDEERYMRELAHDLGLEWLESIPMPEVPLPLREACGPRIALRHRLLPVAITGEGDHKRLKLATFDPFNLVARQAAAQELALPIDWCMASRKRLHEALRRLYGVGADTFEQILEGRDFDYDQIESGEDEANIIDQDDDEEASVVKFVNQIIREALDQRATDIHVEPLSTNLRIRYRIDGRLIEIAVPENIKALQSSVIARLKIMARLDIAERRVPQDGRINLQFEGQTIDVRVATVPTVEGESVSLRLLNQEKFNLAKLQMEPFVQRKIEQLLHLPNGIILITGPTGSGKSTSLYSFLSEVNSPERRIVTVEDPVENKLVGVMQIAVKSEIGLTFATALRSILRADPNIVMIGEIRDLETAEIAIRASLTGHLVFSTLHTNDAPGAITRLVDMGIEPFLVASAIELVIAQRLVRRLCVECSRPQPVNRIKLRENLAILGADLAEAELIEQLKSPVGCDRCRGTGYRGRVGIFEIFRLNDEMHELVLKRESTRSLADCARKNGMRTLGQSGWEKIKLGYTTFDEVLRVVTMTDA